MGFRLTGFMTKQKTIYFKGEPTMEKEMPCWIISSISPKITSLVLLSEERAKEEAVKLYGMLLSEAFAEFESDYPDRAICCDLQGIISSAKNNIKKTDDGYCYIEGESIKISKNNYVDTQSISITKAIAIF
jgi:hypothetical protein